MSHGNNTTPQEWQDVLDGLAKRKQDRDNASNSAAAAAAALAEPGDASPTLPSVMAGESPATEGCNVLGSTGNEAVTAGLSFFESPDSPETSETTTASQLIPEYDDFTEIAECMDIMDNHAILNRSHYGEVEKMLLAKMEDIKTYERTKNQVIQHLDWSAGNPEDPAVEKALAYDAANPEKTTDTANREKIARMVARITFDVKEEVTPKMQFSKSMFFGDWLGPPRGEKECFVEIHVKRIQGNDPELLDECGVSTRIAFLPLVDLVTDAEGRVTMLDAKNGIAAMDAAADNDEAKPSGTESEETKAADKPVIAAGSNTGFGFQGVSTPGHVATTNMSMALPVILPGGQTQVGGGPAHPAQHDGPRAQGLPNLLASTERSRLGTPHSRALFRRELMMRYDHLESLVPTGTEWSDRVDKSFVYVVKVMAIPRPDGGNVNTFTGPSVANRVATLLGMGGWVVPSLEERTAYWAGKGRKHHPKPAKKYKGLPKPAVQRALPVKSDRTDLAPPGILGDFLPLWMELSEPTLEDVYWMVWQLFAGKQYVGVRCGAGFGVYRRGEEVTANQGRNPFKSPSPESIFHTANWKQGGFDEAAAEKAAGKK